MPIEMPQGLPFSVDTWTPSSKRKRHHFLTHAHKDHSSGIFSHSSFPIYCTRFTKTLILQHYPQLDDLLFLDIEVGQSTIIDDPDGAFTVTAFDGNHCPGAVMFLFEGKFGNILHTGDCRLSPECLQNLPDKYIRKKGKSSDYQLDCVFLDCTFGTFSQRMPSKHSATQQVINCIWKHPDATRVYLACDLLGQEEILVNVSQTFGTKIYVDKANKPECFNSLLLSAPEILCEDPSSRFHVLDGFPRLYERATAKYLDAQANSEPKPLIIRPSTQWYACEAEFSEIDNSRKKRTHEAVKDQFGVWHVCYSMHSSKEELEWALQLLAPRWVVSTTPSCRATGLDYVKKHCCYPKVALNNSIWKLLDMTWETCSGTGALVKSVSCCPVLEETAQPRTQAQSPVKQYTDFEKLRALSLPCKSIPVTLFGKARLAFQDTSFSQGMCNNLPSHDLSTTISRDTKEKILNQVEDTEEKWEKSPESKKKSDQVEHPQSEDQEARLHKSASYLDVGSSGYSEGVRKLYRSMNVPVPQPLPSLVELVKSNKRAKRVF
ncbi:hypothetical protein L6164_012250 [Bauhinia variegata]|uniref:Uncharacterized protein n=1 Tax=Bauhinia variegata TaxID=167791 RepID=A0ACB9P9R6_BAUVA|nr:hypothetical protein L6164_012250 [Bauhinia variegata]